MVVIKRSLTFNNYVNSSVQHCATTSTLQTLALHSIKQQCCMSIWKSLSITSIGAPHLETTSTQLTWCSSSRWPARCTVCAPAGPAPPGRTLAPRTGPPSGRSRSTPRQTGPPRWWPTTETGWSRRYRRGTVRFEVRIETFRWVSCPSGLRTDICIGHSISMSSGPPWLWLWSIFFFFKLRIYRDDEMSPHTGLSQVLKWPSIEPSFYTTDKSEYLAKKLWSTGNR